MTTKIQQLKGEAWSVQERLAPVRAATDGGGVRLAGHLEKIKLPQFQGSVEDYAEFNSQFCQLCSSEHYSAVLELSQLKTKLPKEAVQAIVGLTDPTTAWERLDQLYGNIEMSVVAALRWLRNFKLSKHTAHDQVMELAAALQRCCTLLQGIGRGDEFVKDRETVALVVRSLPADSQRAWYRRRVPTGETTKEKGQFMLDWLEDERQAAVVIHLDELTTKMQSPAPPAPNRATQSATPPTTDQGLVSSPNLTQEFQSVAGVISGLSWTQWACGPSKRHTIDWGMQLPQAG